MRKPIEYDCPQCNSNTGLDCVADSGKYSARVHKCRQLIADTINAGGQYRLDGLQVPEVALGLIRLNLWPSGYATRADVPPSIANAIRTLKDMRDALRLGEDSK